MPAFSADALEKLRRRARLPLPTDAPRGWSKSPVDPNAIVAAFRPLTVRAGYVLRGYIYTSGSDGNGVVYAMSEGAPFPDADRCQRDRTRFLKPPLPEGADRSVMDFIEGNGTPRSYLLASILARELLEFGARRYGCAWSLEQIVNPAPTVTVSQQSVIVKFHSRGPKSDTRYIDTYAPGNYAFSMEATGIAG